VEGFSDEYQLNSIIRKEALQRDCKGCKSLPRHQEDEQYARAVGIFPFDANAAAIQQRDATLSAVAHMAISSGKSKTPVPDVVNKDYILHTLTSADTLQGLALRYGVTILAIKRSNNMISDTFSHLSKIVIPTTGNVKNSPLLTQDPKLEAMRQFKRQTNSSTEEAKFYLEDVDYGMSCCNIVTKGTLWSKTMLTQMWQRQ
jgi:LysM repeat protein